MVPPIWLLELLKLDEYKQHQTDHENRSISWDILQPLNDTEQRDALQDMVDNLIGVSYFTLPYFKHDFLKDFFLKTKFILKMF